MSGSLLPLFVDVAGATVVVTGDGPTARGIRERLAALGASVVSGSGPQSLQGALLLVTASEDPAADREIAAAACERGTLTVSGLGAEGKAFLGQGVQRGRIAIAATTSGQSAVLETRLAAAAAGAALEPHHERFAEILEQIRRKLEDRIPDDATRAAVWEQILDSPVSLLLQSGSEDDAVEMAERMAWGTG